MEEYINKKVFLRISIDGKTLFYNAVITNVTRTHISFIDKFDQKYCYRIEDVIEIKEEKISNV